MILSKHTDKCQAHCSPQGVPKYALGLHLLCNKSWLPHEAFLNGSLCLDFQCPSLNIQGTTTPQCYDLRFIL